MAVHSPFCFTLWAEAAPHGSHKTMCLPYILQNHRENAFPLQALGYYLKIQTTTGQHREARSFQASEMYGSQRSLVQVKVLSPGWEKQKKEGELCMTSACVGACFPAFTPLLLGDSLDLWLTQPPLYLLVPLLMITSFPTAFMGCNDKDS